MTQPSTIFYHPQYLAIQEHADLRVIESESFRVCFSISGELAVSLPQGLFGSVEKLKRTVHFHAFQTFWQDQVLKTLRDVGVTRAELIHSPDIYNGFVPTQWLDEVGFSSIYSDINHHILLKNFTLHDMELRRLKQLESSNFEVKQLPLTELAFIHEFISNCREEKGLRINTPLEKLSALVQAFPDRYDLFMAYLDDQPASAVITLKTSANVVYYFLPGTPESMKSKSPMVGLIAELVLHYGATHEYLDLGVSSIEGKPQSGLVTFKERMGGIRADKTRFYVKV